jgi:hypothetical protein
MARQFIKFALGTLLVVPLAACAPEDGDVTIIIQNNKAPDPTSCVVALEEGGLFISRGSVSTSLANTYFMNPLIKNLASSEGGTLLSNRTFFGEGFRVTLSSPDSALQAAINTSSYTVAHGYSAGPDNGLAIVGTDVLPSGLLPSLDAASTSGTLLISLTAFGLMGGTEVESNAFVFPVLVGATPNVRNLGNCAQLPDNFVSEAVSCLGFQDNITQCCVGPTNNLVCPASKPLP